MSQYKYQSFDDAILIDLLKDGELTGLIYEKYTKATRTFTIEKFIAHQKEQFKMADLTDSLDERWHALSAATIVCEEKHQTKNINEIPHAFLKMGEAIERLNHPTHGVMIELNQALLEKKTRDMGFLIAENSRKFLVQVAKVMARRIWKDDLSQKIRITEACDKVWPELVDVADEYGKRDQLPDNANSLKAWLKPIAPAYAQTAGRPKK